MWCPVLELRQSFDAQLHHRNDENDWSPPAVLRLPIGFTKWWTTQRRRIEQWKRFLHPPQRYRVLTTTSSTTCGILYWNLLFFEQNNGIFASYLVEVDLAKIAVSCHTAPEKTLLQRRCV